MKTSEKEEEVSSKELVDQLLQTELSWRDLKRLTAFVEKHRKKGVNEKGVSEGKKSTRMVSKLPSEGVSEEKKVSEGKKGVSEEKKVNEGKKGVNEKKHNEKRRVSEKKNVNEEKKKNVNEKDINEKNHANEKTTNKVKSEETNNEDKKEDPTEQKLFDSTPRKASIKAMKLTRSLLRPRQKRAATDESKPAKRAHTEKEKEPYSLPKVPPCVFDLELRFQPLPPLQLHTPHTALPKPTPSRLCKWVDDLSSPVYYSSALQEQIAKKGDATTRTHHYSDNSVYMGPIVNGMRHGTGKLVYPDGSSYQGQFRDNARFGKGTLRSKKNVVFFEGTFEYDYPKKGVLTYNNGARYEGMFNQGVPDGEGTLYSNGKDATWDGEWQNGVMNGRGAFFYDNGDYFEGEMKEGKRSGEGRVCNRKGAVLFEGVFKDDLEEGAGTQFFADGSFMKVNYRKGEPVGKAVVYDAKQNILGEGSFANGAYSGYGRFFLKGGACYFGSVVKDKLEGKGEYHFDDTWMIRSEFHDNCCHGPFELYAKDRLVMEGAIEKKVLSGKGKEYYPDGSVLYDGSYANDAREGKGRLNFADGSYYVGGFKAGYLSGQGTVYSHSGKVLISGSFSRNQYRPKG